MANHKWGTAYSAEEGVFLRAAGLLRVQAPGSPGPRAAAGCAARKGVDRAHHLLLAIRRLPTHAEQHAQRQNAVQAAGTERTGRRSPPKTNFPERQQRVVGPSAKNAKRNTSDRCRNAHNTRAPRRTEATPPARRAARRISVETLTCQTPYQNANARNAETLKC